MALAENQTIGGEELMWNSRIQVLVSTRVNLWQIDWRLDLCSPFWRLYVNDRLGAYLEFAGKRLPLQPGQIWVVPAWVRIQTGQSGRATQDYVHFTFGGLPSALLQRVFNHPFSIEKTEALGVLLAKWQEGLVQETNFPHLCWANSLVHAAVAQLLEGWNRGGQENYQRWRAESSVIQPALEVLETQIASPPDNRELGRLCSSSEDHFIRKFRKIVGQTPAEYGRGQRIAVAAEWLTGTRRTIEDIAESTGFTDRFHFSRVFRQRLGLTPAAYRRMHRQEL